MKELIITLITGYFIIINIAGLISMGIDKQRAIKKGWRVPERTLLLIAFLGGGAGSYIGMMLFRHKTKHAKFVILVPVCMVIYIAVLLYLFKTYLR